MPYVDQRVLGTIAAISPTPDGARLGLRINIEPGFVAYTSIRKNGYVRHAKGDRVPVRLRDVKPEKKFILNARKLT